MKGVLHAQPPEDRGPQRPLPAGRDPENRKRRLRPSRCGRFQFGLANLLFLAVPLALLCGAWAAMAQGGSRSAHRLGLLLVAAAPVALAIATSLLLSARRRK